MYYLSHEDFLSIYAKVPRLCVDLIIKSDEGILLILRNIEPYLGYWHFAGGTVYKGETIEIAAKRVAKDETGLDVKVEKCLGYMEWLKEPRPGIDMHTVSIALLVTPLGGVLQYDKDAKDVKYFKDLPEKTIKEHYDFLKNHKLAN